MGGLLLGGHLIIGKSVDWWSKAKELGYAKDYLMFYDMRHIKGWTYKKMESELAVSQSAIHSRIQVLVHRKYLKLTDTIRRKIV